MEFESLLLNGCSGERHWDKIRVEQLYNGVAACLEWNYVPVQKPASPTDDVDLQAAFSCPFTLDETLTSPKRDDGTSAWAAASQLNAALTFGEGAFGAAPSKKEKPTVGRAKRVVRRK